MPDDEQKQNDQNTTLSQDTRWAIEGTILVGLSLYVCFILFVPTSDSSIQSIIFRIGVFSAVAYGVYQNHPSKIKPIDQETEKQISHGASLVGWSISSAFLFLLGLIALAFSYDDPNHVSSFEGNAFRVGFVAVLVLIMYRTYPRRADNIKKGN